jgi:hypothetical protein
MTSQTSRRAQHWGTSISARWTAGRVTRNELQSIDVAVHQLYARCQRPTLGRRPAENLTRGQQQSRARRRPPASGEIAAPATSEPATMISP